MPRKVLKQCAVNGCPNLTDGTYCEFHRKQRNIEYSRFDRSKESQQFYQSKEWKSLRKAFLSEHPLCMECLKNGLYVPATIVDHIIPIRMGGAKLDPSNLQSLCQSCHTRKSDEEGSAGFIRKAMKK